MLRYAERERLQHLLAGGVWQTDIMKPFAIYMKATVILRRYLLVFLAIPVGEFTNWWTNWSPIGDLLVYLPISDRFWYTYWYIFIFQTDSQKKNGKLSIGISIGTQLVHQQVIDWYSLEIKEYFLLVCLLVHRWYINWYIYRYSFKIKSYFLLVYLYKPIGGTNSVPMDIPTGNDPFFQELTNQ